MSIRLRVKGPNGQSKTVTSDQETLAAFMARMSVLFETSFPMELLSGYPPQRCTATETQLLPDFLKSGDLVTLREATSIARTPPTSVADIRTGDLVYYKYSAPSGSGGFDAVEIIGTHPGPPATPESYTAVVQNSADIERIGRELNILYMSSKLFLHPPSCSLASSGSDSAAASISDPDPVPSHLPPPAPVSDTPVLTPPSLANDSVWTCSACTVLHSSQAATSCDVCGTPRPAAASSRGAKASRHRIPDDNSCLFHAVIFLLQRSDSPQDMRNIIANAVRTNSLQWSDAMLGKPREAYIRYITDPSKWGGQVELNILCSIAKVEIAAVDIQSGRVDVYGQGSGYTHRVYMLFSGIHFDAVTFDMGDHNTTRQVRADDAVAERSVQQLAAFLRRQGAFTDQQTMRLVCQTCGFEMEGDYEARLHAGSSGHTDFKMKK